MTTRCKVVCIKTEEYVAHIYDGKNSRQALVQSATFTAVTSGSEENKEFFAATPTLTLMVGTSEKRAFEPGKEYYIDIIEAPKRWEPQNSIEELS
jgi:hypothetical protein